MRKTGKERARICSGDLEEVQGLEAGVGIGVMIDLGDFHHLPHLDRHPPEETLRSLEGFRLDGQTEGATRHFQGHVTCAGNEDIGQTIVLQAEGEASAVGGEAKWRMTGKFTSFEIRD